MSTGQPIELLVFLSSLIAKYLLHPAKKTFVTTLVGNLDANQNNHSTLYCKADTFEEVHIFSTKINSNKIIIDFDFIPN